MDDNDGRKPWGYLPTLQIQGADSAVVQVVEDSTGEILYTVRTPSSSFNPPVFAAGKYTIKVGKQRPDKETIPGVAAVEKENSAAQEIKL